MSHQADESVSIQYQKSNFTIHIKQIPKVLYPILKLFQVNSRFPSQPIRVWLDWSPPIGNQATKCFYLASDQSSTEGHESETFNRMLKSRQQGSSQERKKRTNQRRLLDTPEKKPRSSFDSVAQVKSVFSFAERMRIEKNFKKNWWTTQKLWVISMT